MAGYIVHLAIAKEYCRKHKNQIKNEQDFLDGSIAPDGVPDKKITHYGPSSSKVNLKAFLDDKKLDTDFNKGYFLHLVTDYLFYNRYLTAFSKDIYNDYDVSNDDIVNKYHIIIPEKAKRRITENKHEYKLVDLEFFYKVIDEISEYDLETIAKEVYDIDSEWLKYRKLIRLD